uniref:TSC22 domain family member 4 n=1 Tax=Phasianus colchicus TaxID=9054 RepID=A0A669QG78_PHACC
MLCYCRGGCTPQNSSVLPPPHSSSSGVSAIDNKIEQAMDLVKSHLLLAVREEVELLREQIKELSERRAVLERENGALRAIATPQQLAPVVGPDASQLSVAAGGSSSTGAV